MADVVHPVTGEVLDAEACAREWARLDAAVKDAQAELGRLVAARDELEPVVRAACEEHGRLDAGKRWVVLAPPARRPSQRVNSEACDQHQEVLLGLGLGRVAYRPPSAADLRQKAAAVVAAGLPFDVLLPEPPVRGELTTASKGH